MFDFLYLTKEEMFPQQTQTQTQAQAQAHGKHKKRKADTYSYTDTEIKETNTCFLPNVDFCKLWYADGVTETTREVIWHYLQLLMITVIENMDDVTDLGDTATLLEAIDQQELSQKLQETMQSISSFFEEAQEHEYDDQQQHSSPSQQQQQQQPHIPQEMPDSQTFKQHLESIMGGKLGRLASELSAELMEEWGIQLEDDSTNSNKIFQKIVRNPTKMMSVLKKIGAKLNEKINSGELNKSEVLSEGFDMLKKLKEMPGGMGDIGKMMGMNMKNMNMAATEAQLKRQIHAEKQRERMRNKAQNNQMFATAATATAAAATTANAPCQPNLQALTDDELVALFESKSNSTSVPHKKKRK
jgi:hypothetical protein